MLLADVNLSPLGLLALVVIGISVAQRLSMPQRLGHGLVDMLAPFPVILGLLPALALKRVFYSRLALTKTIIPAFGIQRRGQVTWHILVNAIERARGLTATAAAGFESVDEGGRVALGQLLFAGALTASEHQRGEQANA